MTEVIRAWEDPLFYIRSDDPDAYAQIVKLQRIGKHVRALSDAATVDTNGDILQDILKGQSLGNLAQRHKYRALYDSTNDRYTIQRNSGTDASKTWVELLRIDASGNLTAAGGGSFDTLTATDGGLTVSGDIDVNGFYIKNLDKVVGLLRTDSLRVHQGTTFDNTVTFNGITLFYQNALKALAFKDQVRNAQVATDAAIARNKIAAGTTNRLVYNDGSTGLLADLASITTSRALQSNSSTGLPEASSVSNTELSYLIGVTSAIQTQINNLSSTFKWLATYSPSSTAAVDITSVISSTYPWYIILIESLIPATDDVELRMLTSEDNGSTFKTAAGSYEWIGYMQSQGVAAVGVGSTSSTYGFVAGDPAATGAVSNVAVGASGMIIYIRGLAIALYLMRLENAADNAGTGFGTVRALAGGSANNAIRLLFESGDVASGAVYVYGVKSS